MIHSGWPEIPMSWLTLAGIVASLIAVTRALSENLANRKVDQIEKVVFQGTGDGSVAGPSPVHLFQLYNGQIERYHTVTRSRATWSFFAAILASLAGLGFIFYGVTQLIGSGWESVAKGSAVSAIGGAVGAYIAKTFLDVHRLSLLQLNRYSHQPVLNSNILAAQRLADKLGDEKLRQRSYQEIIDRIAQLIAEEQDSYDALLPAEARTRSTGERSRNQNARPSNGASGTERLRRLRRVRQKRQTADGAGHLGDGGGSEIEPEGQ